MIISGFTLNTCVCRVTRNVHNYWIKSFWFTSCLCDEENVFFFVFSLFFVCVSVASVDKDIIEEENVFNFIFSSYIYPNSKSFFFLLLSLPHLTFVTVIWIYTNRTSKEIQTHVHRTVKFKNVENHLNAFKNLVEAAKK